MQGELDRRELALMLDKVGFGAMPKDSEGLDDKDRRAFVGELRVAPLPGRRRSRASRQLLRRRPSRRPRASLQLRHGIRRRGRARHTHRSERPLVRVGRRRRQKWRRRWRRRRRRPQVEIEGQVEVEGEIGLELDSKSDSKSGSKSGSKSKAGKSGKDGDDGEVKIFRVQGIENAVPQSQMSYTPGMAVSSGIVALRTCKSAGLTGDALAACVEKASAPENVIAGPLAP